MEAGELLPVEALGWAQGMDLRAPQRLVDVDVPHAGERPLVEQRSLDGRAAALEEAAEPGSREQRVERLLTEARREVRVELARLQEQPGAESAYVAVGDVGAVVERDERPPVRVVVEPVGAVPEAAGHPQVDEQHTIGLEPDDQILAAPLDRRDALSLELGCDSVGLVGPHEPRVGDLDAVEPPAREDGLQPAANGLDLGQLGHASSLDSGAMPNAATACTR